MPTAQEVRTLQGPERDHSAGAAGGGDVVGGRIIGLLEAEDGFAVLVELLSAPGRRLTYHFQHIATVERRP